MRAPLTPCFWYDSDSAGAAALYLQAFGDGRILEQSPLATTWELYGRRLMGINGGPRFLPNPSLSLFVNRPDAAGIERAFEALADGGRVLMPLEQTPWSPLYGWVEDRYGVSWQLAQDLAGAPAEALFPALMFVGAQLGRAREAITQYTSVFPHSSVDVLQPGGDGGVLFALVRLAGQPLAVMDSPGPHEFAFSEGASLSVACDSQAEIDHFWDRLVEGGEESRCGWLKDRYGLSWQVVPAVMGELMADPERAQRVVAAFMPMRKLDLDTLLRA